MASDELKPNTVLVNKWTGLTMDGQPANQLIGQGYNFKMYDGPKDQIKRIIPHKIKMEELSPEVEERPLNPGEVSDALEKLGTGLEQQLLRRWLLQGR